MKPRTNILITQRYVLAATMMRRRHGLHAKDIAVQNVETPLTLHDDVDWSELVDAIADATRQLGADRHTADLIIPSSWCYMCQLEQTEKRFNADAAAFEMEDYIPVPLERITVVFDPRADMTLGVAVLTEPLAILLRQMEERGIHIDHVWVDVLMATAVRDLRSRLASRCAIMVVWRS